MSTTTDYITGTRLANLLVRQVQLDDLWTRMAASGLYDAALARLVDEIIALAGVAVTARLAHRPARAGR